MKIHSVIREKLGFNDSSSDKEILDQIKAMKKFACKPCWEIKYCPYGPLVEDFPLLPWGRQRSIKDIKKAKECISKKIWYDGNPINTEQEKTLREQIKEFNHDELPELHPDVIELECNVFGHLCPVFFVAEPFTETKENRRDTRYIPFDMKMRIVRRDNHTCQECGKHLLDNEVEFDHIIPHSKGGSSEEHNIRLTCFDCNRQKSNKIKI